MSLRGCCSRGERGEADREGEEWGVVGGLLGLAGKGRDGGWLEVAPPSFVLAIIGNKGGGTDGGLSLGHIVLESRGQSGAVSGRVWKAGSGSCLY